MVEKGFDPENMRSSGSMFSLKRPVCQRTSHEEVYRRPHVGKLRGGTITDRISGGKILQSISPRFRYRNWTQLVACQGMSVDGSA